MSALVATDTKPVEYTANQTDVELRRGRVVMEGGQACLRGVPQIECMKFVGDGSFTVTLRKVPTDAGPTAPSDIVRYPTTESEGEVEIEGAGPRSGFQTAWPGMTNGAPDALAFSLTLGTATKVTRTHCVIGEA